jgi:hypothetical protein
MGLLAAMREFDVYDNLLDGKIPEQMYSGMGDELYSVDLANCLLTGTISTNIGLLETCVWYVVEGNKLTGTVPTEVGNMQSIQRFYVNGNLMNGTIPAELCQKRGAQGLNAVKADCSPTSSGEIPQLCPAGCCDECCNQETGICLPAY